ncbi:MAG: LysM peptidoglycan-binding domain-containing protein, partial [Firmicutes bacterium]|nr:LysM peptidoglycan-binding domain-containing protein [Bacillota bacterium]
MEKDNKNLEQNVQQAEVMAVPEATQVCGPNTTPYIVRPGDTFFSIAR